MKIVDEKDLINRLDIAIKDFKEEQPEWLASIFIEGIEIIKEILINYFEKVAIDVTSTSQDRRS